MRDQPQTALVGFESRPCRTLMQPAQPQAQVRLEAIGVSGQRFFKHGCRLVPLSQSLKRGRQVEPARGIFRSDLDQLPIGCRGLFELLVLVAEITGGGVHLRLQFARLERALNLRQGLLSLACQMQRHSLSEQRTSSGGCRRLLSWFRLQLKEPPEIYRQFAKGRSGPLRRLTCRGAIPGRSRGGPCCRHFEPPPPIECRPILRDRRRIRHRHG